MNKQEFIKQAAKAAGMTKRQTEQAANALIDTIKRALTEGEPVKLQGFGTFEIRTRQITGRNFATGEILPSRGQRYTHFEAADAIKTAINEGNK